jgi:RNA polymerase sigma factor (sigma-70 family)
MLHQIENERFRKLLLVFPSKAIELLYEFYYEKLIQIASRLTHDSHVAEDIVQDVFLYIWKQHKELSKDHKDTIENYLIKAVKNRSFTYYSKHSKVQAKNNELLEYIMLENDLTNEGELEYAEKIKLVRDTISEFPKMERECLLHRLDGLSTHEIAVHFGITVKAVERSITSAKKRLQKIIVGKGSKF